MPKRFRSRLRQLAQRIAVVGLTWGTLALLARVLSPAVAVSGSFLPLGLALRGLLRLMMQRRLGRLLESGEGLRSSAAVLLAGAFLFATFWPVRAGLPGWVLWLETGALLHYWLLAVNQCGESSH